VQMSIKDPSSIDLTDEQKCILNIHE
ncbi:unnamed protein product, partial [Didymodactylos carnosus]